MRVRNWVIGGFVVAAIAITWGGINALNAKSTRDETESQFALTAALARAEKLGVPVYPENLRQDLPPDEENAWFEILELHKWYEANDENRPEIGLLLNEKDDVAFLSQAQVALTFFADAILIAERAAKKNKYYPLREWEMSMAMLMSDLATMKLLMKVYSVKSRYELLGGKPEQAIESLKTASTLIGNYVNETTLIGQILCFSGSYIVAKETVQQAMRTDSETYLQQLQEVLDSVQPPIDYTKALFQEQVLFIGWVKMASIDSELGNQLRQEFNDQDSLSVLGGVEGTSLSPLETRKFEALAIEAVCDYSEALKSDAKDFAENDRLYEILDSKTVEWCINGYSVGFVEMALILSGDMDRPYSRLARLELGMESYRLAFAIASGEQPLQDGLTMKNEVLPGATLQVTETDTGWSITAKADGIDEITQKFDRPQSIPSALREG